MVQDSNLSCWPQDIFFLNSDTGWIAGGEYGYFGSWWGMILHTTDGGDTWEQQCMNSSRGFLSIYFTDPYNGWAVGRGPDDGIVLHTSNGGESWQVQLSGTIGYLYDVYFMDSNTGWIVGNDSTIGKTVNGGMNWTWESGADGLSLKKICFTGPDEGWIIGGGTILHTENGGETWKKQESGITGILPLTDISFVDADKGWICGASGLILHTNNGGIISTREEKKSISSLLVYPNPSDNGCITLALDNPNNRHLACFNTFGQQVLQLEIRSGETVIDVSTWPPGIYLAVVYEGDKPVGKAKFIIH